MTKYGWKKSNLISLITSANIGIGVRIIDMQNFAQNILAPKVNLDEVFKKVNNNEIKLGEEILVKGFLSPYAPVIEPTTYSEVINILHEKRVGNKVVGDRKLEVKGFAPVVSKVTKDSESIGYLYLIDENHSPFEFKSPNKRDLVVSSWNRYIPVSMSTEVLHQLSNKIVTLSCQVKIFNHKKARELFDFKTNEFSQLITLFYDDFALPTQSIYLAYLNCESSKEHNYKELKVSYGVEVEITSDRLTNEELKENIKKVFYEVSKAKDLFYTNNNKRDLYQSIIGGGQSINYKDDKIGVYQEVNISNADAYRVQLKGLLDKINEIIDKLQKNSLDIELTFISDDSVEHLIKTTIR